MAGRKKSESISNEISRTVAAMDEVSSIDGNRGSVRVKQSNSTGLQHRTRSNSEKARITRKLRIKRQGTGFLYDTKQDRIRALRAQRLRYSMVSQGRPKHEMQKAITPETHQYQDKNGRGAVNQQTCLEEERRLLELEWKAFEEEKKEYAQREHDGLHRQGSFDGKSDQDFGFWSMKDVKLMLQEAGIFSYTCVQQDEDIMVEKESPEACFSQSTESTESTDPEILRTQQTSMESALPNEIYLTSVRSDKPEMDFPAYEVGAIELGLDMPSIVDDYSSRGDENSESLSPSYVSDIANAENQPNTIEQTMENEPEMDSPAYEVGAIEIGLGMPSIFDDYSSHSDENSESSSPSYLSDIGSKRNHQKSPNVENQSDAIEQTMENFVSMLVRQEVESLSGAKMKEPQQQQIAETTAEIMKKQLSIDEEKDIVDQALEEFDIVIEEEKAALQIEEAMPIPGSPQKTQATEDPSEGDLSGDDEEIVNELKVHEDDEKIVKELKVRSKLASLTRPFKLPWGNTGSRSIDLDANTEEYENQTKRKQAPKHRADPEEVENSHVPELERKSKSKRKLKSLKKLFKKNKVKSENTETGPPAPKE